METATTVVTENKNKNKNVSDDGGKEKSPSHSDHSSDDDDKSVSGDDDDIFDREKRWVYEIQKGTPYPKLLKADSPDYNDQAATRDIT